MEVLSSSYSSAASPFCTAAVEALAGAGAGAARSPEKKWSQMDSTTASGDWKEGSASTSLAAAVVPENDTEEQEEEEAAMGMVAGAGPGAGAGGHEASSSSGTGTGGREGGGAARLKELFAKPGLGEGFIAPELAPLQPAVVQDRWADRGGLGGAGSWLRPMCTLKRGQSHRLLSFGGSKRCRRSAMLHTRQQFTHSIIT